MKRHAFTLIELLTVIAILAILAAIIFPVYSRSRQEARMTQCMSNLSSIHSALKLYHQDYQAYPILLMGYVERYSGGAVVPPDKLVNSPLYKDRVDTIATFKCPMNRTERGDVVVQAVYPRVQHLVNGQWRAANDLAGQIVQHPDGGNAEFYAYDSYDIGLIRSPADGSPVYELHYMLFWTDLGLSGGGRDDDLRQLGYRFPDESSIVTWCTYHRDYGAPGNTEPKREKSDIVLTLSGTVKKVDSVNMALRGFGNAENF